MKTTHIIRRPLLYVICAALLAVTASTTVPALMRRLSTEPQAREAQGAYALLEARRFELEQSYTSYDSKERPEVTSGWALVLRVPPHLSRLRNSLMEVLCVGDRTAERWNSGGPAGQIVVTVPASFDAEGRSDLDLTGAPVWFAAQELPERVDRAWIARERARASEVNPFPLAEIEDALQRGGGILHARDHSELGAQLSRWVDQYSPEEAEYAASLR